MEIFFKKGAKIQTLTSKVLLCKNSIQDYINSKNEISVCAFCKYKHMESPYKVEGGEIYISNSKIRREDAHTPGQVEK